MTRFDPITYLTQRGVSVRYGLYRNGEPLVVPIIPDRMNRGLVHRVWGICISQAYIIALQIGVPSHAKPLSVQKLMSYGTDRE